ncbi:MAG: MBOAT family protein [Methylococcaceae bacterium]|nr:MBOAT family protein [Methylococcaceae bacterium]MDD1610315.1 MBOAT family protein [Methylococcaceae bacterium]
MIFNSYVFIFAFLPVVIFGFYGLGRYSHHLATLWLAAASLFFYGWWDARFVGLLLGSIAFNYGAGYVIGHSLAHSSRRAKLLLIVAIIANLSLLGYFKYANFFIDNLNALTGSAIMMAKVFLPLGISFFTFTQLAFLVDTYQGKVREYNFVHYTLFVTYFPHLIAGPVLHHKEMMPQFGTRETCRVNWEHIAVGLSIFVLGLAKKVLLADSLGEYATPIFEAVKAGGHPMLFEAWFGALSYSLQLYFDFSGYSDMAIGLSLMFNVRLPLNFNSPYKSLSIIEFWRCWHMTLSRFLRDYLYIPLGGSHKGKVRRYVNLLITMLLGGLWHGAGWTYVIWGGLHGLYLVINHGWRGLKERMGWRDGGKLARFGAGLLTFLAVVVGWVFFRADNFTVAMDMLNGMAGMNGWSISKHSADTAFGHVMKDFGAQFHGTLTLIDLGSGRMFKLLILGLFIVFKMPNVQQIMANYSPALNMEALKKPTRFAWQPSIVDAVVIVIVAYFVLINLHKQSTFLYFQF